MPYWQWYHIIYLWDACKLFNQTIKTCFVILIVYIYIYICFTLICFTFYVQSTHMASKQITEEAVYLCTGNPMPKDIEQIAYWLLNESFSTSFKCILNYQSHTPNNYNSWFKHELCNMFFAVSLVKTLSYLLQVYLIWRWEKDWPWLISYGRSLCMPSFMPYISLNLLIPQIL